MRTSAVDVQTVNTKKRLGPATKGAVLTAGVLTASTAFSWLTRKGDMLQIVNDCGGKANYLKTYGLGLVILSSIGALTSSILSKLVKKVKPENPPKPN